MSTAQANTASPALISLDNVKKYYHMGSEEVRALDGVTISFTKGDFWAIMGPSGSGKSTMLNILGCLDHPTAGRFVLDGYDASDLDDDERSELRLRRLGFIFQSFNLIPQLTVQENIELPLYYLGYEADRSTRRAEELADLVGLGVCRTFGAHFRAPVGILCAWLPDLSTSTVTRPCFSPRT
jgi:putative ABC transport system ATP-binding protein